MLQASWWESVMLPASRREAASFQEGASQVRSANAASFQVVHSDVSWHGLHGAMVGSGSDHPPNGS